MKKALPFVISVLIAQGAGLIGSLATFNSVSTWYLTLNLPSWNPPSALFGPVWVTLYTLMGIAAALIWKRRHEQAGAIFALRVYGVHLVLNTLWSVLFFGLHMPGLAFAEILVLFGFVAYLTAAFWKLDKRAGLLLVPYVLWVGFASVLNFTIWQLN